MHTENQHLSTTAHAPRRSAIAGKAFKPILGWVAALVSVACATPALASPLTLEEALRTSALEHPSVLARRSERNAAHATLDVAERQQYPNLSFQSTGDSFGGRANTLRIEQPLWLGGRIRAGIDAANASIQQADAGVTQAQVDIMFKVVAAFTELGRIQARQVAASSNVQEHARLAQMIRRRVDSEISPSSDSTLAAARFSQARAELNQLVSQAVRARSTLGQAIGKPVDEIALPVQRDLFLYTLDRLNQAALDYAPSIRRLEGESEAARAEIKARQSDALPQVKLRLDRTNSSSVSNTQVYVAFDVQTGAGMSVQASVREAQARRDALQSQIEAVRRETIDAVSADWADLSSFAEQARDLKSQVDNTTEVFDSFVRQYAIGRKGWNDVLNAQREVAQARFQLADATWGELRSSMRLHLFTGLITGDHVALSGPTPLDHVFDVTAEKATQELLKDTVEATVPSVSVVQSLWQRIAGEATPAALEEVPAAQQHTPLSSKEPAEQPESIPSAAAGAGSTGQEPATPQAKVVSGWDLVKLPPVRPQIGAQAWPVPSVVTPEYPIEPVQAQRTDDQAASTTPASAHTNQ